MTIEETIRDERLRAQKKRELAEVFQDESNKVPCLKVAERHEQRAKWLEELVRLRTTQHEIENCARIQLLNELFSEAKEHPLTADDIQALIKREL